jgi:hypothetical protein
MLRRRLRDRLDHLQQTVRSSASVNVPPKTAGVAGAPQPPVGGVDLKYIAV